VRQFIFLVLQLFVVASHAEVYQLYEQNGKKGIKDGQGTIIIPATFEALGWSDGSFSVIGNVTGYRQQQKWGIINLQKQLITPPDFEMLVYGSGDNIIATKQTSRVATKTGVLNLKGQIKIPFAYDDIQLKDQRAIVVNLVNGKFLYGLTDLQNKPLLPIAHKNIFPLGSLRFAVQPYEGKLAVCNENGRPLTDFTIDSISSFYNGYAIVYENFLQGLIDREGKIKLKPIYQSIKIDAQGRVVVQLPTEWRWMSAKNEVLKTVQADELTLLNDGWWKLVRGNRMGVLDSDLQVVIPTNYKKINKAGKYFVAQKGNKYGVIDQQNKTLLDFQYDSLNFLQDSFLAYSQLVGWQLLDASGKVKTEKRYQSLNAKANFYVARYSGYQGLLDYNGKEILHCVFDSILQVTPSMATVKYKGQYGIMDLQENWKVAPQAFPLVLVNDTHYLQRQPQNTFLKTFNGKTIYFTPYATTFEKEFWIEHLPDGRERHLSYDGTILPNTLPVSVNKATQVFHEREGLRGIHKDGKFGFVDAKGKLSIANRYDSIQDFNEGLAPIKLIGKWGFINTRDEIVVQPNYQWVSGFHNGICIAQQRNGKFGVIDPKGQVILNFKYDELRLLPNKKLELVLSTKKGRATAKGQIQIEARFDDLHDMDDGNIIAVLDGNYGVLSEHGLNLIPSIYHRIYYDPALKLYVAQLKSEAKQVIIY
jgi:calcineurin-like phosphoesterase